MWQYAKHINLVEKINWLTAFWIQGITEMSRRKQLDNKWGWPTISNPSHPCPPPPHAQGLLLLHMPPSYHLSAIYWYTVRQGCFITPPLTLFAHFWQPLFLNKISMNSFSRSLLLHLPFTEPMPITYTKNAPATFLWNLVPFYEGEGDGQGFR